MRDIFMKKLIFCFMLLADNFLNSKITDLGTQYCIKNHHLFFRTNYNEIEILKKLKLSEHSGNFYIMIEYWWKGEKDRFYKFEDNNDLQEILQYAKNGHHIYFFAENKNVKMFIES
jgi:hypothetical protein